MWWTGVAIVWQPWLKWKAQRKEVKTEMGSRKQGNDRVQRASVQRSGSVGLQREDLHQKTVSRSRLAKSKTQSGYLLTTKAQFYVKLIPTVQILHGCCLSCALWDSGYKDENLVPGTLISDTWNAHKCPAVMIDFYNETKSLKLSVSVSFF